MKVRIALIMLVIQLSWLAPGQTNQDLQQGLVAGPSADTTDGYVLGPGDELTVWVLGIDELESKTFRIDTAGYIDLPIIGRMKVAGRTLARYREDLRGATAAYVKRPEVSVNILENRSQPVSVVGSVNKPGVLQLRGGERLIEVLSMAGGLRDDAGPTITLTRRIEFGSIGVPGARTAPDGKHEVAVVAVRDVLSGHKPEVNVTVSPHDVISVGRASTIYVLGEVHKSGGFLLADRDRISVLEAIAMAEGPTALAVRSKTRILRKAKEQRTEILIDLDRIIAGKAEDFQLQPEDIVFVPTNKAKRAATRAMETAINVAAGITIWRVGIP